MANLVPIGAWDTHIHVFDPDKFPYATKRSYTPKAAHLYEYPSHLTGCKKIVVVEASMQGKSAAPLVDVLKQQKNEFPKLTLRGLATIDVNQVDDAELDELHSIGVRGIRFFEMAWGHGPQSVGEDILRDITAASNKTARLGWIVDVFCPLSAWAAMAEGIRQMDPRTKVVADHFGGAFPGDEKTEDFQKFLSLVTERRIFVKTSAFERLYHGYANEMNAIRPIFDALLKAGPDQVIFGTDWPHTGLGVSRKHKTDEQRLNEVEGFRDVPDAKHVQILREWVPDDDLWKKLLVTNAENLFH